MTPDKPLFNMKLECNHGKGVWLQNGLTIIFGNTMEELMQNEGHGGLMTVGYNLIVIPGENEVKESLGPIMQEIIDAMHKLRILMHLGNGHIAFKAPGNTRFLLNGQKEISFWWEKYPVGNTPELFRAALKGIGKGLITRHQPVHDIASAYWDALNKPKNGQQNEDTPKSGQQKSPGIPADPSSKPATAFSGNEWEIGALILEEEGERHSGESHGGSGGDGNEK